jgi:hypothetical protein
MPRIDQTARDREVEIALAEIDAFENPAAWRRSAKGNMYRQWDSMTVTVFCKRGMWGWCVADAEETRFSRNEYETEDDAKMALAEALGVGLI